jgi:hypothetical protein
MDFDWQLYHVVSSSSLSWKAQLTINFNKSDFQKYLYFF